MRVPPTEDQRYQAHRILGALNEVPIDVYFEFFAYVKSRGYSPYVERWPIKVSRKAARELRAAGVSNGRVR
jgi:hypothetical protein